MNADQIRDLLKKADATAGPPRWGPIDAVTIRRQVHRRRIAVFAAPAAAAAVLVIGVLIWAVGNRTERQVKQEQSEIARLSEQVEQLQAQADATLRLVQDVLAKERRQRRLAAMETELTRFVDPVEEMKRQADRTAVTLIYKADRLYRELNLSESATEAYKQVIRLYPESHWADVARERLDEINARRFNKSQDKGEKPCERTEPSLRSWS